ncbi:heavy metal-associated domain-containing protein [Mycobacterium sp.]|uniref:heavy-metal-associated domain-containing protein n=1 Tax=Mycobacterium sp. TaxID=1785 RepID=UPI0012705995|nr:heavy metal-associated domain-containing protein [Mycobacterium sp.]KAA8965445.1 MAG: heavy-metal-associated domain-containing protein [Mycobacterium sp.]
MADENPGGVSPRIEPSRHESDIRIDGMACASCAARIDELLNAIDGVTASVDFARSRATVTCTGAVTAAQLVTVIEEAGYKAEIG